MAVNKKIVNYEQLEKEQQNKSDVFLYVLAATTYIFFAIGFSLLFVEENRITLYFWYSLIAFAVIMALIATKIQNKFVQGLILAIMIFTISWFAGYRQNGVDDWTYRGIFTDPDAQLWIDQKTEKGFLWLNRWFRTFNTDFNHFRFFISAITIFCTIMGFWKHRHKASFPLCVLLFFTTTYFYLISINLTRIQLAASICFYHFDLLERKKPIPFYIVALACTQIHSSSYFYFIFLPFAIDFKSYNISKSNTIIFYIIYTLAFSFGIQYIAPLVFSRYKGASENANVVGNMLYGYALFLVFAALGYKFVDKKYNKDITLCVVSIIIFFVISSGLVFNAGGRLVSYYSAIIFMTLTICYKQANNNIYKYALLIGLVAYTFVYIYSTQFGSAEYGKLLIPYRNVLFTIP